MNGSEEGDVLPAAVLSGAPIELEARTVRYDLQLLQLRELWLIYPASTVPPRLQLNLATGMGTNGAWTGISSPRATDGRIL
jgi:hypothetical protein